MLGTPKGFWAKLHRRDDHGAVDEWHPLIDHCADVAAVVEALLELPVWQKRLARLARRDITATDCARLCVFAALHDIGKLNLGFQAKGRSELGPTAGHVKEAIGGLCEGVFSCFAEIEEWGKAAEGLLITSVCHHGQPYSLNAGEYQTTWWKPRAGLDPRVDAAALFAKCHEWFPQAFVTDAALLPEHPEVEHAFAGLVMLADWLGSDTVMDALHDTVNIEVLTLIKARLNMNASRHPY